ncbi:E3 ubiquitin-protein ligase TRIM33 [Clarias gariepinus]|uniref:E3 ubiquitin-protein ligase TRIM33 n=1 Tax=Clarias gariepinus TaxID=13013 RepID=UPI00234DC2C5|nr:E3 ubiquitin-protein ligase TRIM33 [Clarias gariepinus]
MNEERGDVRAQKGRTRSSSVAVDKAESCAACRTKLSFSTEPKLLPCLHMMCKGCVINTTEEKNSKECPMCGQSFNLSEVTDCFIFKDSAPKCGGCDETALSGWCKECEEALCSDCVSAHQRVKVTRNHTVIPQETQSGLRTSLRCTAHKQERLKFFCVTCGQLTCRDCQLIDHRNHSFLLLEEAVVAQKDHLKKLLDSIKEQRNSVRASLQDLDVRLNSITGVKEILEKQLHQTLHSIYDYLMLRCRQLCKELEGLCNEEEKSLKVMKTSLKKLEDRQEYITAFLHKVLNTEGQCVLRHKMQIEKLTQKLLSQKKFVPDTVIQLSLSFNKDIYNSIKHLATFKVTRIPAAKGKANNGNKPTRKPQEEDKCPSGLNSKSGATLSESGTASVQATAYVMSNPASNVRQSTQSLSVSAKPVQNTQGATDIIGKASPSSISRTCAPPQTTQSNIAQHFVAQAGQHLPQSASRLPSQSKQVFRSLSTPIQSTSLPRSSPSSSSQAVLNIIPSNLPHGIVMPPVVLPQSQPGVVLAATAPPDPASSFSVPHPFVSVQTAPLQSSNLTDTQSHPLTHNQSVPSLLTLAPFSQSSQAMPIPHPCTMNSSSVHTQQNIPQTQDVSGPSVFSQTAPTSKSLPYSHTVSSAQSANLQASQLAATQSNHLQVTLLNVPSNISFVNSGAPWKFHHYTPVLHTNKGTTVAYVSKPTNDIWMSDWKSLQPTSGDMLCSQTSEHIIPPVVSNKELDSPASGIPPVSAAPVPSAYSNIGQVECATQTIQMPNSELPVKAPADSVCEGDMSVCSRASPVAEVADNNLPTSTVPGKDTKAKGSPAVSQLKESLSTTSIKHCPPNQIRSESPVPQSPKESPSTTHWLVGMPSSFKELICGKTKVPAQDACSKSVMQTSLPIQKDSDEKTDDSDSEFVLRMDESEEEPILSLDSNKTPVVSLVRLPISGSSRSRFRIIPSMQKTEILLQEIEENQSVQRCLRIRMQDHPATASPIQSCGSEGSLQADVLECAVCHSIGASLQCAKCGRSFHTHCHVPPIFFSPIEMWVCSLCQDVLDDTDPFSCSRLKEPYLSLSDQRKCEQLLLFLMCEKYSYLLYKSIKHIARCVKFNLILGRLLGRRSPPYRSAAEMVSDLWALFDNLSSKSRKKKSLVKLQNSFQQQLTVLFGKSLHASLLKPLSHEDQTGAPEPDLDREKARNTLKRMREFLAVNCAPVAKKAHTDNT